MSDNSGRITVNLPYWAIDDIEMIADETGADRDDIVAECVRRCSGQNWSTFKPWGEESA